MRRIFTPFIVGMFIVGAAFFVYAYSTTATSTAASPEFGTSCGGGDPSSPMRVGCVITSLYPNNIDKLVYADWGDGVVTGPTISSENAIIGSHTYTTPGSYTIILSLKSTSGGNVIDFNRHYISVGQLPEPTAVPGGPGFLMLGAADFMATSIQDSNGTSFIVGSVYENSLRGWGFAPVHLPQGAQITKITAYYRDTSTTLTPTVALKRQSMEIQEVIATIPFPNNFSAGADVRSTDITSTTTIIDNQIYSYLISARMGDTGANNGILLYQVRVDYRTDQVSLPLVTK